MDLIRRYVVSKCAELDQLWAQSLALFGLEPERMIRLWDMLREGDMQPVRELSDEDLKIVAALAMLSLNQLTHDVAERMTEASQE